MKNWRFQVNYALTDAVEENLFIEWKNWHAQKLQYLSKFDLRNIQTSANRSIAEEIDFYLTTNNGLNQYTVNGGQTKLGNRQHKVSLFTRDNFSTGWSGRLRRAVPGHFGDAMKCPAQSLIRNNMKTKIAAFLTCFVLTATSIITTAVPAEKGGAKSDSVIPPGKSPVTATLKIDGEFPRTKEVRDAALYDATEAKAHVEQGVNNYGFLVRSSPRNARWLGGRVYGRGVNQTGGWSSTYAIGNGAGLIFHESPGFTVEDFYSEWSWDGIRPARNASGDIVIRKVWLKNIRDDAIESDHLGTWSSVRVEKSLIEDTYVIHSCRRGANATGPTPAHRLEYEGNLLSLGLHPMDLAKRAYPWSRPIPGHVSGQTFKTEGNGRNMTLLFRNNVVKIAEIQAAAKEVLNVLPANATLDPQSGGNVLVWLGGSPRGLEMEQVSGVLVPKDFKIDRKLWTVTDDPRAWTNARSRWIDTVWKKAAASGDRGP